MLVELMKQAAQTKQYAELDHAIKTKVEPFLYNKGAGRKIPIWKLVLLRNKDRARHKLVAFLRAINSIFPVNTILHVRTSILRTLIEILPESCQFNWKTKGANNGRSKVIAFAFLAPFSDTIPKNVGGGWWKGRQFG